MCFSRLDPVKHFWRLQCILYLQLFFSYGSKKENNRIPWQLHWCLAAIFLLSHVWSWRYTNPSYWLPKQYKSDLMKSSGESFLTQPAAGSSQPVTIPSLRSSSLKQGELSNIFRFILKKKKSIPKRLLQEVSSYPTITTHNRKKVIKAHAAPVHAVRLLSKEYVSTTCT